MDALVLLRQLEDAFPGRVVALPPDNPDEIIIEPDATSPPGVAIAYIRRSKPHLHRRTTETYFVEDGAIILHSGRGRHVLYKGDSYAISPGVAHFVETKDGSFARVRVTSDPPWSPGDHELV